MKKKFLILTYLIFLTTSSQAQYAPSFSSTDGISREVTNTENLFSIPPGFLISFNILNVNSGIDTSLWEFAGSSTDGKFRFVKNKIP